MHAADVAYALAILPLDDRHSVWEQVTEKQAARVFVEVDAVVRESLVDRTAFVVSRVSGRFESTIGGLAPLAAPMPSVASIGGNTGNQTNGDRDSGAGRRPGSARRGGAPSWGSSRLRSMPVPAWVW